MKPTYLWFLAGLAGGGTLGTLGGALLGAVITFSDSDNREVLPHILGLAVDGWGCTDLGTEGQSWADLRTELRCVAVVRAELAPGHTITRADLHGINLPLDYLVQEVLPNPVGAVVTRRILAGESVRAERVQGGTP